MKTTRSADPPAPQWEGRPPTYLIQCQGRLYAFLHSCPHAQTLEAYSQAYGATVWIPLRCNRWSCRYCAESKVASLARKTARAEPNRLLTLTIDPSRWDTPRQAFDGTRRKVPELVRHLRRRYNPLEYLRVTELTRNGWPHYHLLVRSPYIPHAVVKKAWYDLTGASIVDIRQVKKQFVAYTYLMKYLSKLHNLGWTERHVSYSKHFFPDDPPHCKTDLELTEKTIIEAHPATYLYARWRGAKLTELTYGVFTLNAPDDLIDRCVAPPEPKPPSSPQPPEDRPADQPPPSTSSTLPRAETPRLFPEPPF